MRRFATTAARFCLAGLLCCAAARAQAPPDATVGRACALTVVMVEGAEPWGTVFPISVRATAGSGRYSANASIDRMVRRTLDDACTWIASRRGVDGYRAPEAFPDGADLWVEFPAEAQRGVVSGDSAGAALACAIYSAVSGTPVLNDVAMTGAIDSEGTVHAVAHIRTKLDGVLAQGLSTMVLPAENWWRTGAEARQLWSDAVPRIRVVFAADLEDVFFFALGPYGPQGAEYQRSSAALAAAMGLLQEGDYERARVSLAGMLLREPGDSTAQVWKREAEQRYARQLVEQGIDAVREGRLAAAELALRRGLALADGAEMSSAQQLASCLGGASPPPRAGAPPHPLAPESGANGSLPVYPVAPLPESPESARWQEAHPVDTALGDMGSAYLAAAEDRGRFSLAVSYADPSGRVEEDPGRWYATEAGFAVRGREDRVSVALGDPGGLPDAARSALDFVSSDGVDAWVFGAGPLCAGGHALDLAPWLRAPGCDAGDAPLLWNAATTGGPLGSWDGMLGREADPRVLRAADAGYLKGAPLAGRATFATRCASCHGAGQPGRQGLVPEQAAWEPWGGQAALERFLREDEAHSKRAAEGERADLVAYIRTAGAPPSWLSAQPTGSAADVSVRSTFVDGRWWVVFTRARTTGFDDDLDLTPAHPAWLAVAVRDGASGRVAATAPLELAWR